MYGSSGYIWWVLKKAAEKMTLVMSITCGVHHLMSKSYQRMRVKGSSSASTLLQTAELTQEHPSEVRQWRQREVT